MPSVLFAALLLFGLGLRALMRGVTPRNLMVFACAFFLCLLPIAAMAASMQRASLGAAALYALLIVAFFVWRSPARGAAALLVLGGFITVTGLSMTVTFGDLSEKTALVGLNMRPQETAAVWSIITENWTTLLFGLGWGAGFHSPAVGGLFVNFTHNFFTSLLLKTGLCGLLLASVYIGALLERLARLILRDPVVGLALAAPILIDLTLYASFKSFDFGLVLLMISGALIYSRQSESLRVSVSTAKPPGEFLCADRTYCS